MLLKSDTFNYMFCCKKHFQNAQNFKKPFKYYLIFFSWIFNKRTVEITSALTWTGLVTVEWFWLYFIYFALGRLIIIWKLIWGILYTHIKQKEKIFVSEQYSLWKENQKALLSKIMLSVYGNCYTGAIIRQYHSSCQFKNILEKSTPDVPYTVGRVFRENFLCNSASSVRARLVCYALRLFSEWSRHECTLP